MQESDSISPEIIEQIKNDDPTVITKELANGRLHNLESYVFQFQSRKCFMKLVELGYHYTCLPPDHMNLTRKMSRVIFDNLNFSRFSDPGTIQQDPLYQLQCSEFYPKIKRTKCDFHVLINYISKNKQHNTKFILENLVIRPTSPFDSGLLNPSQIFADCDEEMIYYYISKGLDISDHKITPSMFINNQVNLIKKLQQEHGFIIDYSQFKQKEIREIVLNNSIEAMQLFLEGSHENKFIDIILNFCAIFNCTEMLDMILSHKDLLIKPNIGNKALLQACQNLRFEIVDKLLIPQILNRETVNEALSIAGAYKDEELISKLQKFLENPDLK